MMKNGLIYPLIAGLITFLSKLNVVEYLKKKGSTQAVRTFNRNTVDFFIIGKFTFVFIMWTYGVSAWLVTGIVWYLIISNVFTYFQYHVWNDDTLSGDHMDNDRKRRRFCTAIIAFFFSAICFAYLYAEPYAEHLQWEAGTPVNAFKFALGNVFSNISGVKALPGTGDTVVMIQKITTWVFIAFIVKSISPASGKEKK